jgi:hypothetical protein
MNNTNYFVQRRFNARPLERPHGSTAVVFRATHWSIVMTKFATVSLAPVSLALVGALGLSAAAAPSMAQDYYRGGYPTPCAQAAHRSGTSGAVLGALAGAALGSNLASHHGGRSGGALIGALAGAAIGNNIGRSQSADRCDGAYGDNAGYGYAPAYGATYYGGGYRAPVYRGYERRGHDYRYRSGWR